MSEVPLYALLLVGLAHARGCAHPPGTGPMVALGEGAVSYERGTLVQGLAPGDVGMGGYLENYPNNYEVQPPPLFLARFSSGYGNPRGLCAAARLIRGSEC